MASQAQIEANRQDAQKSAGPRTAEGKEKASRNAITHGLFAREGVIRGEDWEEFAIRREMLMNQLRRIFDRRHKQDDELVGTLERWREEDWEAEKARRFSRCPPPEASEGVPDLTCQASSESCKTNPICGPEAPDCGLAIADCGLKAPGPAGRPLAPAPSEVSLRIESCKTCPTSEAVSSCGRDAPSESCETNPIEQDGQRDTGAEARSTEEASGSGEEASRAYGPRSEGGTPSTQISERAKQSQSVG